MLYHKEIGFPSTFRKPVGKFSLDLSRHAQAREIEKGFSIPREIDFANFDIIEIEVLAGRLSKVVIRGEYDKYDDICIVISFGRRNLFVKTAWLNAWDDVHSTLDVSKYGRP